MEYTELDIDRLALEASEIDTSGITVAGADRLKKKDPETNGDVTSMFSFPYIFKVDNFHIYNTGNVISAVVIGEGAAALTINENLFTEDDLEDLEEELGDLELEE